MISNNTKLDLLLQERDLMEGRIVRYVYALENERNELFFIHRVDQLGRVSGDFYLGWQLGADCYWGSDLWDVDIIEMAAECINQTTNIPTATTDIQLIDVFHGNDEEEILHIAYYVKYEDTNSFRHWSDWDDDAKWLPIEEALAFAPFEEDKRIIRLVKNGAVNLLESDYSTRNNFKKLHQLMDELAQLSIAVVGKGYLHPIKPNLALQSITDAFLEEHAFLKAFPNYVEFLKVYGGALLDASDGSLHLEIAGFTDETGLPLTDEETPIINEEDGYYVFSIGFKQKKGVEDYLSFAFDATGNRKKGIYKYETSKDGTSYYFLQNQSFLSWLAEVVETKGRID